MSYLSPLSYSLSNRPSPPQLVLSSSAHERSYPGLNLLSRQRRVPPSKPARRYIIQEYF